MCVFLSITCPLCPSTCVHSCARARTHTHTHAHTHTQSHRGYLPRWKLWRWEVYFQPTKSEFFFPYILLANWTIPYLAPLFFPRCLINYRNQTVFSAFFLEIFLTRSTSSLGGFLSSTLSQAKMSSVVLPQQATVFPTFNYLFISSPASVYHPVWKLTPHVSSVDHTFFLSPFIMAALCSQYSFCIRRWFLLILPPQGGMAKAVATCSWFCLLGGLGWAVFSS